VSIETFGDYQLIKRLATGGMAQIYLARKQGPEGFSKFNVVKRILPHLSENEEFVKMFLDEARIAARLDHPNIVQIFDFGAADDTYFIAMEYIQGEDVRRVWKATEAAGKSIPVPLVCRIISDASAGLDFAHAYTDPSGLALNIVHRDVSPQNILVTFEGGVKVVDFGIAKAADQATVTRSGVLKGKYSYMSPEQAAGKRVDRRTDIFALGVVMYELLTGDRLFKRTNDILTLNAVSECDVKPPSSLVPSLPRDLDAIVMKALAKDPEDRYQEAGQLRLALEDWLTDNRQPGSNAHLAGYMKELFAERIAAERESGPAMMEELRSSEEYAPSPRSRSSAASLSPKQASEVTASARPERASPSQPSFRLRPRSRVSSEKIEPLEPLPPPVVTPMSGQEVDPERSITSRTPMAEPSLSVTASGASATAKDPARRRGRRAAVAGMLAAMLVAGAGLAWLLLGSGQETGAVRPLAARVRVDTVPFGARVWVDGSPVEGETPLELPPLAEGEHTLMLRREGFQDLSERVTVPASGELRLPQFRLWPAKATPQVQTEPVDAGWGTELPPERHAGVVSVALRTQPPGALLELDGRAVGTSPVDVEIASETVVRVRAVLAGFVDAEREVRLGASSPQEILLPLKRKAGTAGTGSTVGQGTGGGTGGGTGMMPAGGAGAGVGAGGSAGAGGTGLLKIAVTGGKWASVTCNGKVLGDTPFPARELAAGTYQCKFVYTAEDESPSEVSRTVEIRAGQTSFVPVTFP
jgi:serine/threonine protein kinase